MYVHLHTFKYVHPPTPRAHEKKNKQMNKKLMNFPKFTGLVGTTVRLWMTGKAKAEAKGGISTGTGNQDLPRAFGRHLRRAPLSFLEIECSVYS